MFLTRNYDLSTMKIRWHVKGHICEVIISKDTTANIMCLILTNEKKIANHDFQSEDCSFNDIKLESTTCKKKNFISTIVYYAKNSKKNIKQVILIFESIPILALQEMSRSPMQVVHFSYQEILAKKMSTNIYQPLEMKRLNFQEAQIFKRNNPRYAKELTKFGIFDKLTKYLGFEVGDIVSFVEFDEDCGYVPELGIVVQDLRIFIKKKVVKKN